MTNEIKAKTRYKPALAALALAIALSVSAPTALAHADEGQLGAGVPATQSLATETTSTSAASKAYAEGRVKGVKATEVVKNTKVKVTWKAVEGAQKYQVRIDGMVKWTQFQDKKGHKWTTWKIAPDKRTVDATSTTASRCGYVFKKASGFFDYLGHVDEWRTSHKNNGTDYFDFFKHSYKVRVRYMDADGNWSRWSAATDVTIHLPIRGKTTNPRLEPCLSKSGKYQHVEYVYLDDKKHSKDQYITWYLCIHYKKGGKDLYKYSSAGSDAGYYFPGRVKTLIYTDNAPEWTDGKKTATVEVSALTKCVDSKTKRTVWVTKWSEPVKLKVYAKDFVLG